MAEESQMEAAETLAEHMEDMGLAPYGQTIRSPETTANDLISIAFQAHIFRPCARAKKTIQPIIWPAPL